MNEHHHVENVRSEKRALSLTIDGVKIVCELKDISPLLTGANDEERAAFRISPSGYGIHWYLIDEDVSINGLLGIVHSPESNQMSA